MGGVDSSKWKPRQLRGTPAYAHRTKVSLAILAIGVTVGVIFNYLPFVQKSKVHLHKVFFTRSEEEEERKYIMTRSLIKQRTAREIGEIKESEKQMFSER